MRSTFPLSLGGTIVRGLEVRFEAGKAVEVRAESGADAVREEMATDEGSSFLGEVALVDGDSRVRKTGVVFYDTLFDENAACHIAWGQGIKGALDGGEELSDDELAARGYNDSVVHTDFMIGGPEVTVLGVERSRRRGAGDLRRRLGALLATPNALGTSGSLVALPGA